MNVHDILILGGGPAGYAAALYAARAGLDALVLEKLSAGGQMALTTQIDNYPGFDQGVDGFELGEKMQAGAERFGARSEIAEVTGAELHGDVKTVHTAERDYAARAVIIATGASHRHLGLSGENELIGRGVNYCAACDGMLYRGKTVAVVGGGNSAAADALLLSRVCKKVYVVHRRDRLRATKIYHTPLTKAENVEFVWNNTVDALLAGDRLTALIIKNTVSGVISELPVDGVFISIGRAPETGLFGGMLELEPAGYIIADESTRTSVPGVFAAGDVRTKALRQIVTAVSDGATAAHYAEEYLMQQTVF